MDPIVIDARYALLGEELEIVENVSFILDQDHTIIDIEEIHDKKSSNLVFPGFYNAHTHAGDNGLRGKLPPGASLEELVGDNSIKQKYLDSMTPELLIQSLIDYSQNGTHNHVTLYSDFREDGIGGVSPYLQSPVSKHINLLGGIPQTNNPFLSVLSRPANLVEAEVLSKYVGLGIRDIYYYDEDEMVQMKDMYHQNEHPIQIHVAEDPVKMKLWEEEKGETDIVWAAKNLSPELLVHTNHGTEADYQVLKDLRIPVAFCPTSNEVTSTPQAKVDLLKQIDFPIDLINLGSDNGMFAQNSVSHELAKIAIHGVFSYKELLQIAMIPNHIDSVYHLSSLSKGKTFRAISLDLQTARPIRDHKDVYKVLVHP